MTIKENNQGFTTVELLITLFVAATFLIAGYQLYGMIINDSGEARAQAQASNVAYDYLQRYKANVSATCTAPLTLFAEQAVTIANLSNVTVSVLATCPYGSPNTISKVVSTVKFNDPQQTVSSATYVTK